MTQLYGFSRQGVTRIADAVNKIERIGGHERTPRQTLSSNMLGVIVDRGPDDEPDYTDERYWVRVAYVEAESSELDARISVTEFDAEDLRGAILTVSNLAELGSGSHGLRPGTPVVFGVFVDRSEPRRRRFWMSSSGGTSVAEARVLAVNDNTLSCVMWPLPDEGEPVMVEAAKPWLLRRNPWHRGERGGITYRYDRNDSQRREATLDDEIEIQELLPRYLIGGGTVEDPGDLIKIATPFDGEILDGVNGDPVYWFDLNNDGRYWAEDPEAEEL